jgi:ABC-type branched-subunit amino acid transport system substrate-binding protein
MGTAPALAALAAAACNSLTGLDDLAIDERATTGGTSGNNAGTSGAGGTGASGVSGSDAGNDSDSGTDAAKRECQTNQECTDRASAAAGNRTVAAACIKPEYRCVQLLSEDCTTITGDYLDDEAIFVGSLFGLVGAQAATNLAREQSATLAIEEINRSGGVPAGTTSATSRPLVMVSCNTTANLVRAGTHLVNELHVPAIVGPNTSQDTLDLSTKVSIPGGAVVLTPSAIASSIISLVDNDLTWLMQPSDVQRGPVMIRQIKDLEAKVKAERAKTNVKLGIIFRDDALGIGTRTSIDPLILNGKPLADPINLGQNVRITGYDGRLSDQKALVDSTVAFAPDIVVLAGTAEVITAIMTPLEQAWPSSAEPAELTRPYYVTIDPAKGAELLAAVSNNDGLRRRVRGAGLTPGPASVPVYNAFRIDYQTRYPGSTATIAGMGTSYDAAYAIAYALAATKDLPVSGENISEGFRKLVDGPTNITTGPTTLLSAFQKLAAGERINATGTFGPLAWDADGAPLGGTIEVWCIGAPTSTPVYQSSGLSYDLRARSFTGEFAPCGP